MKRIELCIATIVLVSLLNLAQAGELYQKDAFSISLPDGWNEIPRQVIDAYEQEVAKMAPNAPAQHFDYGFQLGGTDSVATATLSTKNNPCAQRTPHLILFPLCAAE